MRNHCLDCNQYFRDEVVHDCNPIKSQPVLMDFVEYCHEHPEERFWQALRNWSKYEFIFGCKAGTEIGDTNRYVDTFYKKGK